MKIHNNIEQGSDDWFAIRKGKLTASHAQAIGNIGKGLDTYINELMSEYYSSGEKEQFTNKHTERGNELEPVARQIYELENDCVVEQVGFIEYNDYVGCSPDGLIGEDGGLEIKCIDDKGYFQCLLNNEIDSKYIWQVQMNLLITGRRWWDLVIYNPNYQKSMLVYRIEPDNKKQEALLEGFKTGEAQIIKIKEKIQCI
jgi:putative phage-type endonuclease